MNHLKNFAELNEAKKKAATKSDEPKKKKGANNQKGYKFYALNVDSNKIVAGNEYKSDAQDVANEFLEDEKNKGKYKVYTKSFLTSKGIDADSDSNWANS